MAEPAVAVARGPRFASLEDAATPLADRLDAAASLTQQLDALGACKAHRSPDAAAGDLLVALWLLGCPTASPLHKGAGSLVASVASKAPALVAAAIPAWYEWMMSRAATGEAGALETAASVLFEVPVVRMHVTAHVAAGGGASIAAASELVARFAGTLAAYSSGAGGGGSAPSAMPPGLHGACEDATSALKLAATLLADAATLRATLAGRREVAETLLRSSLSLLTAAPMLPKEALTHVGLVLGRLVFRDTQEAGPAQAAEATETIFSFLLSLVSGGSDCQPPLQANDLLAAPLLDWPAWWASLSTSGQLGLVRGLLIATPRALAPGSTSEGAMPPATRAFLVEAVPAIFLRGLEDPQDIDRIFALHVLETWLAMLTRLGGSRGCGRSGTPVSLPEALTRQVSRVILANWEHRNRRISALQPRLLEALLELQAASGATSGGGLNTASTSLVDSLLSSPVDYMPRYAALAQAIPRVGAVTVLARRPDTPGVLLAAVQALAGNPTPGNAHTAFFTQLRRDMEAAQGLSMGVCGGSTGWWRRGDGTGAAANARMRATRGKLVAGPLRPLFTPAIAATAHMSAAGVVGPLLSTDAFIAAFPWASSAAATAAAPLPPSVDAPAAPSTTPAWAAWWAGWWRLSRADPLLACLYGGAGCTPSAPLDLAAFTAFAGSVKTHLAAAVQLLVDDGALPAADAPAALVELLHADIYARWIATWAPHTVACAVEPIRVRRARAVQQGLADLVLLDLPSHEVTGKLLAVGGPSAAADAIGDDGSTLAERRSWARMQIARMAVVANQRDVFIYTPTPVPFLALDGHVTCPWMPFAEALCGVYQGDPDGRLSTVEVVAASIGNGSVATRYRLPDAHEYTLLEAWLSACLKCGTPDFLRRGVRIFHAFLTKCLDTLNALARDLRLAAAEAEAAANGVTQHPKGAVGQRGRRAAAEWVAGLCALHAGGGTAAALLDAAAGDAPVAVTLPMVAQAQTMADVAEAAFTGFVQRTASIVARCLYPRAPFDRLLLPLELAKVLVEVVGFPSPSPAPAAGESTPSSRIRAVALTPLLTVDFSTELVNTLVSSWERARDCAVHLVAGLPRPLPGFDAPAVAGLMTWALALSASTRQREYEGGATLLRMVHSQFVVKHGWQITIAPGVGSDPLIVLPAADADPAALAADAPRRSLAYLTSILDAIDRRCNAFRVALQDVFGHVHVPNSSGGSTESSGGSTESSGAVPRVPAEAAATGAGEFPQPHGALMAARFVLEDLPLAKLGAAEASAVTAGAAALGWRALVVRLGSAARHALSVAMQVVAGTGDSDGVKVGGGDAEAGANDDDDGADAAQAAGSSSGGGDDEEGEEMEVAGPVSVGGPCNDAAAIKRGALVIGAWLTTREACLALAGIVDKCPLPVAAGDSNANDVEDDAGPSGGGWLLSCAGVRAAANALLDALLALKHIGCIAMAGEALRIVSSRLLLHGSRHPGLSRLPESWLRGLFVRMGQAMQFILRRSAGFAQSFLSIIRSEPRVNGVPLVLLDLAATELLRYTGMARRQGSGAGGDEWELTPDAFSWRSHVHALNTLRLFFREASFSESMTRYIAPAIRTAVAGFKSKAWAVRNSSMMLFAVACDRALGSDARNLREGAKSSTTTSQFFTRFPSLFPFLLAQMQEAAAPQQAAGTPLLHPVLFPIMLLLSRMAPEVKSMDSGSTVDDEQGSGGASFDMSSTFLPLLLPCLRERHTFIRRMAARAISALLPPLQALPVVASALETTLPLSVDAATPSGACDWNSVHGALLAARVAIAAVLLQCKPALVAGGAVADALAPLTAALSSRPWVVASPRVPGFVRAVALEALESLDEALSYVPAAHGVQAKAFRRALLAAAGAALTQKDHPTLTPVDAGHGGLLHAAARVTATHAARAAFAVGTGAATGAAGAACRDAGLATLASLLSSPSHEVRTGAAKKLKAALKHARTLLAGEAGAAPGAAAFLAEAEDDPAGGARYLGGLLARDAGLGSRLASLLLSALAVERYPDAGRALAHALQLLTAAHVGCLDAASESAWETLLGAYAASTDALGRAHLLRVLGRLTGASTPAAALHRLPAFVGLVASAADDAAAYRLRLAAQQALAEAQTLAPARLAACVTIPALCTAVVTAFQVVLTGLQDHDDEVRDGARGVVQGAVTAATACRPPHPVAAALASVLANFDATLAALPASAAARLLPLPSGSSLHTVLTSDVSSTALCDTVGIPLALAYAVAVARVTGIPALSTQVLAAASGAPTSCPPPPSPVTPDTYLLRPLFIAEAENAYAEERVPYEAAAVMAAVAAGAPGAGVPPVSSLSGRKGAAASSDGSVPFVPAGVVRDEWVAFGGPAYD